MPGWLSRDRELSVTVTSEGRELAGLSAPLDNWTVATLEQ
jgi:hypothetical protein